MTRVPFQKYNELFIEIFSELKMEKIKFFTQSPPKIFCINILDTEGCLVSCLTFR